MSTDKAKKIFSHISSSKNIHEAILYVENSAGDYSFVEEYNKDLDSPMLMASVTKLLASACVLSLIDQGQLNIHDKVSEILDDGIINGIHVYKGKDYSDSLTIEHLLHHTSGLPDFYLDGKESFFKKVIHQDFSYTFEDEVAMTRKMTPHFAPGSKNKAYYTDINFDLLGKVIEKKCKLSFQEACVSNIFQPLNLQSTYIATDDSALIPPIYYKHEKIDRPLFIRSCFAGGGAVTTARELMILIKAFMAGRLFNKELIVNQPSYPLQLSFFPIRYSTGHMVVEQSVPLGQKVTLAGHSGSTGSFAFYCPQKDLFIVGDVPQAASPATGTRLAIRMALALPASKSSYM